MDAILTVQLTSGLSQRPGPRPELRAPLQYSPGKLIRSTRRIALL